MNSSVFHIPPGADQLAGEQLTLIRLPKVKKKVDLGGTFIYANIAAGKFPRPIKVGKASLWVEREIDRWIADRIAERDRAVAV